MPLCSLDPSSSPLPVLALAYLDRNAWRKTIHSAAFVARTAAIIVVVGVAIAVVLLPFWIALIHYPVTQTPIPHPSRANYILSPQWGLNYFVVPYGALILALPFIFLRARRLLGSGRCCSASGSRSWSASEGPLQWADLLWAALLTC